MIKLFRNIRKNLLNEGNTAKYFKYAIGEIVLVVIGILIALQINNANENRKIHNTEKIYLENIKADLKLNLKSLDKFITYRDETLSSVTIILDYFDNKKPLNINEFNLHSLNVMGWIPFQHHDNTYQELLNSGKLSILSSKGIKDSLQNMQTNLNIIRFIESEMEEDYERYLYEPFFTTVDLNNSLKNLYAQQRDNLDAIPELNNDNVQLLLNNITFKNGFVLADYNSSDLIREYSNMKRRTNQLIDLINKELEDHD